VLYIDGGLCWTGNDRQHMSWSDILLDLQCHVSGHKGELMTLGVQYRAEVALSPSIIWAVSQDDSKRDQQHWSYLSYQVCTWAKHPFKMIFWRWIWVPKVSRSQELWWIECARLTMACGFVCLIQSKSKTGAAEGASSCSKVRWEYHMICYYHDWPFDLLTTGDDKPQNFNSC
jgi:hypothetical protein